MCGRFARYSLSRELGKNEGSGLHNLHIYHFLYPVDRFAQFLVRPSLEFDSPGGLRDIGLTHVKS